MVKDARYNGSSFTKLEYIVVSLTTKECLWLKPMIDDLVILKMSNSNYDMVTNITLESLRTPRL